MQIKTLITDVSDLRMVGTFDAGVNRFLEAGWTLTKRAPLSDTRIYVELVKEDEDPEETQMDGFIRALQTIRRECEKHESCETCPMWDNCCGGRPCDWELPGDDDE